MTTLEEWKTRQLEPWKREMEAYMRERKVQREQLKRHATQLQTIMGLLMEGRTRQAVLAWNTLQLHPKLKDVRVSGDGEILTLVATDGTPQNIKLDEMIAELEKSGTGRAASAETN